MNSKDLLVPDDVLIPDIGMEKVFFDAGVEVLNFSGFSDENGFFLLFSAGFFLMDLVAMDVKSDKMSFKIDESDSVFFFCLSFIFSSIEIGCALKKESIFLVLMFEESSLVLIDLILVIFFGILCSPSSSSPSLMPSSSSSA